MRDGGAVMAATDGGGGNDVGGGVVFKQFSFYNFMLLSLTDFLLSTRNK